MPDILRNDRRIGRTLPDAYSELMLPVCGGHALWSPRKVANGGGALGDVGYIEDGAFEKLFNVYESPPLGLPCLPRPATGITLDEDFNMIEMKSSRRSTIDLHVRGSNDIAYVPLDISPATIEPRISLHDEKFAYLIPPHPVKKDHMNLNVRDELRDWLTVHYDNPMLRHGLMIITKVVRSSGWLGGVANGRKTEASITGGLGLPGLGGLNIGASRAYEVTQLASIQGPANWTNTNGSDYTLIVGFVTARGRLGRFLSRQKVKAATASPSQSEPSSQAGMGQVGMSPDSQPPTPAAGDLEMEPLDDLETEPLDDLETHSETERDTSSSESSEDGDPTLLALLLDHVLLTNADIDVAVSDSSIIADFITAHGTVPSPSDITAVFATRLVSTKHDGVPVVEKVAFVDSLQPREMTREMKRIQMEPETIPRGRGSDRLRYDELANDLHAFQPPSGGTHAFSSLGGLEGYPGHQTYPSGSPRRSYTSFPDHDLYQSRHPLANPSHLHDQGMHSHYVTPLSIPDSRISPDPRSALVHAQSQSPDISLTSLGSPWSSSVSLASDPSFALVHAQSQWPDISLTSLGSHSSSSVPLAPDQLPTTQGKTQTPVYVACLQCRSRQLRCDGGEPTCDNCTRRYIECQYDAVLQRSEKPGASAPALDPAVASTTYNYPPKVVELRKYADSIATKVSDLKSKRDPTPGQISAHALSIAEAVESACARHSLEVLEPFAAVAVEEIVRLFSSCCAALDAASQKPRFGSKLSAFASRATSRSPSPSFSPTESTSLDDYRLSLESVKGLLHIENAQSQLVYSGTLTPVAVQNPALLHNAITTSTVIDQVFKTALQTMANMTDGLPFPYKAVAQTVLQFHQHVESYRRIYSRIGDIMTKIDDFVKIVARHGGRKINSGEETVEAIETFFRAVQSIIVRLEILRVTRRVKRFAAPGALSAALAEADAELAHAQKLLNTSLQVNIHHTVYEMWDAQVGRKSDVTYSSALLPSPKRLHGRGEELSRLVAYVIDRSRPIRVAIMGAGGLGKTTLAAAVVHHAEAARTFRDRRFFVTAEAAAGVEDLLTGMLTTFGLPTSSDPLASLLQHLRSHERTLLIIDNLETIWYSANAQQRSTTERVLSQLNAVTSLTLIITCRGADLPPGVDWANCDTVVLSTLTLEAALATFTDIAGDIHPSDQPVRDALLREVDYMPLAVTLLARLVACGEQLRDLDRRWNAAHTSMLQTEPNGRLDNFDASVQLSIAYLSSDNPAPLQFLSLCAQLPDGMRLPVRKELERLYGFHGVLDVIHGLALVYVTDDETIRMLRPIRLFVLEKHIPQAAHRASLLQIYYDIARQAPGRLDSQFPASRDRILPELNNIDALLLSEIQNFDEPPSTDLIDAVNAVSAFSGHYVPNARLLTGLIPRIEHLPSSLAYSLGILASIFWRRGEYDLTLEAATRARSLYQSLGQPSDAAHCDMSMAKVHQLKRNYPEAMASLSAARETFDELGSQLDVTYCDRDLAMLFYDQGNYDDAAVLLTSARQIFLRLDDPVSAAFCQEKLGDIDRIRGDYPAAETQLESALQTYTALGSMSDIASCSCSLGELYRGQQRLDAALERLQVAYDIGQKLGDTLRIAEALRIRSYVHRDQREFAQVRRLLLDAQRLYESIGDTRGVERCADALEALERAEQA